MSERYRSDPREAARLAAAAFAMHADQCPMCQKYKGGTAELAHLCLKGVELLKAIDNATIHKRGRK